MLDFVEAVKDVGYTLDIGYWMIDLERRIIFWPKGLGNHDLTEEERGYRASPLDRLMESVDEADRGRFRGFLAAILKNQSDQVVEILHQSTWGEKIHLRLAGRQVGAGKDAKIIGLVEVISRRREAERLARSLGFIVEALFISSDAGIVILDDHLKVRRLNRNALDLFGISEADEETGDFSSIIEHKLPPNIRELLAEAIENSSAVSGTLAIGGLGGRRLAWRANPWGNGAGEMSGLVLTLQAKRQIRVADLAEREMPPRTEAPAAPPPALPPAPAHAAAPNGEGGDAGHRALEWVKHPILLVAVSTGEIAFANRAARDIFHLPTDRRSFVENVYDLSGFACDVDPLTIAAAGGHVLRLKLGARVGRMIDYDPDLLFIEYHEIAPSLHPHAPPRSDGPAPLASQRSAGASAPSAGRPARTIGRAGLR